LHQSQDNNTAEAGMEAARQAQVEALRREAARTREFVAMNAKRRGARGGEIKSNVTDPESAKIATNKGVIQGYAAQAAVDAAHQVISGVKRRADQRRCLIRDS
jgi:hypothetical protein